ncbi:MAG TPA: CRISPR-associated endonuclease Cas2 [Bryobacteraceae bacterium]|nr:CRISPR-associated endonuclease Cas2 [Bryobacteraceae bacterium]
MRFVICYDVSDDARRERLASALLDFGPRIQESVFVATLDEELLERMLKRVRQVVDSSEDAVHVFAMCAACERRIEVIGRAAVPEDQPYYVL